MTRKKHPIWNKPNLPISKTQFDKFNFKSPIWKLVNERCNLMVVGGGRREIDQFNQFDQIDQFGNFQKRKRKRNPPIQTKVKPFDLKFLTNCNNFKQQTKLEMSHPKIGIQKLAVLETTVKYSAGNWRSDWLKYWNIQNCGLIVSNSKLNVQKFQLEIGNSSKKFGMYLWNWTKPRKFQTKKLKWFKNKKPEISIKMSKIGERKFKKIPKLKHSKIEIFQIETQNFQPKIPKLKHSKMAKFKTWNLKSTHSKTKKKKIINANIQNWPTKNPKIDPFKNEGKKNANIQNWPTKTSKKK